jgi:hypothetical protein
MRIAAFFLGRRVVVRAGEILIVLPSLEGPCVACAAVDLTLSVTEITNYEKGYLPAINDTVNSV